MVTIRTGSATTTSTIAVHIAFTDNATPISPTDIPLLLVIIRTDCTALVLAIMKRQNAELRTIETAHALCIVPPPKRPTRVPILADIMTLTFDDVSTIRPVVLTIARTANATGTRMQVCQVKFVLLSEDPTHTVVMRLDDPVTRAIFRTYSTAVHG